MVSYQHSFLSVFIIHIVPVDRPTEPSLVLILKWGGELTPAGRVQAEELGRIFRCMYPGGQGRHLAGWYSLCFFKRLFVLVKAHFFVKYLFYYKEFPHITFTAVNIAICK